MAKPPNDNNFPAVTWSWSPGGGEGPGQLPKVKGYEIVKELGEGGMGIVYLAEQKEPIKRKVALKVIKPGMDSSKVIARFEAERQALAMLDHPNIAHIFDAGRTELGRPYFSMEYVTGTRITDYCKAEQPNTKERLELFIQVCHAIQHAHQKGIIHRDIKPSNIIVSIQDDKATPKVIDFGVAKALSQRLTESTIFTEQGQLIGTPEYMSPEQAEMTNQDTDTRSDIYSLGVLLYELLTSVLPFDRETLRQAALGEIQRIIREEEPVRPSKIIPHFNAEIEAILFKALAKKPDERYQSAIEFRRDIERWLEGLPITARSVGHLYLLKKFVVRHRTASTIVSLLFVIIFSSYFVSLYSYSHARQALKHSQMMQEAYKTEAKRHMTFARQVALDLFLEHWHGGNIARAHETLKHFDIHSREYLAAKFLLETASGQKEHDYHTKLSAKDPSFWAFIVGEYNTKEGNKSRAIEAYRQCLDSEQDSSELDDWFVNRARRQLKRLSDERKPPVPSTDSSKGR